MNCILSGLILPKLESKEGVLSPRDVGVYMDLVEILAQMGEPLASNRSQVHLRPGGQVHVPELLLAGHFCCTGQFVGRSAQEIAPDDVPERPFSATVFGHADLELASGIAFFALTGHVTERIDGEVFAQVGAQIDQAWKSSCLSDWNYNN